MLHEKDPLEMNKSMLSILPALLKTLSDPADEVVLVNLQILASISLDKKQFVRVLNALVMLFLADRSLLETRGALVIRKLCVLLDSHSIYLSLADILNDFHHIEFVSQMVQTLNLILLTAPELASLRKSLKNCFDGNNVNKFLPKIGIEKNDKIENSLSVEVEGKNNENESDVFVFTSLFKCWCNNPVATFSLCLLSQAYDLSSKLILKFADVDVTVGFLLQIDKLVQLIESPIFIHLRLQLLEVSSRHHGDLLKSLYGLLMVSRCGAMQCSVVQCSVVLRSVVLSNAEYCSVMQCNAVLCSGVECSAVQCSGVLYNAIKCADFDMISFPFFTFFNFLAF
jgi:vacuole morphology and inheritance protein 14